jgi:signal transduction histidine kinase
MSSPVAAVPAAASRGTKLSSFLTRLIWMCVLPLLLLAGWLAYDNLRDRQNDRDQEALLIATNYATSIDQQIRAWIRGLLLLDASPLVDDPGHWRDLYRQAGIFHAQFGGHVTFAEAEEPMRIVFDTRAPYESPPLHWTGTEARAVAAAAVATGASAVGNVCSCTRPQRDTVALAVPVRRGNRIEHVLTATYDTAHFAEGLQRVRVPAGWHLDLLDAQGNTIASQGPHPVGRNGPDSDARRVEVGSKEAPWSVVVEIQDDVYRGPLTEAATVLALALVGATFIGVFGGWLAGRRLDAAVAGLAAEAGSHPPRSGIREIDAARRQLDEAAALRDSNELLEQKVAARTAELAEARNRISAFAAVQEERVEQERRRLAREVHDQLGQVFTAIKLIVQSIPRGSLPAEQHEALGHALELGIASARKVAGELRPPLLDDFGLGAAIGHFARETLAATTVASEVDVREDDLLGPAQALALFRIAQEAVTNALRHADAGRIRFVGRRDGERYVFVIEDDGRGFEPSQARRGAMGITSMSERASLFGGVVRVTSAEGKGTRVEATLPLEVARRDEHPPA